MKLVTLLFINIVLVILATSGFAAAGDSFQSLVEQSTDSATISSPDDLVSFVDSALAYVKDNGKGRSLQEFSNRSGPFVRGDSRIFALDFNGTVLADPLRPWAVGKSERDSLDVNGVAFVKNLMNIAAMGSGFSYYVNPCPVHNNTAELKLVYAARAGNDWWLASSFPLRNVTGNFNSTQK
jgi:signal transduction histidine kinase